AAKLQTPGRYQIEAAIQSVHCDRKRTGRTQWSAVAALHDALSSLSPSTGAAVARAAAYGEAFGAEKGLAILDEIPSSRVSFYQPYWAVRASLTARGGNGDGVALAKAIALERDAGVKRHLAALSGPIDAGNQATDEPPGPGPHRF
ncbi:MAG: hypothetical protein AAGJ94_11130, partial [Pseudomonadota bacterium]